MVADPIYLYNNAEQIHQILDNWQAPANTKVIQIGGWGEETLAGIDYVIKKDNFYPKTKTTLEGDQTVATSSALWMNTSANTERWWVDLKKYNGGGLPFGIGNNVHKDILEVNNLRNFLKSKMTDKPFSDPENIIVNSRSSILASSEVRVSFNLYSGGDMYIQNNTGKISGMINGEMKEEIHGVIYMEIGATKYISVEEGEEYTLHIADNEKEVILLDIDKSMNGNVVDTKALETQPAKHIEINIPTTLDMQNISIK